MQENSTRKNAICQPEYIAGHFTTDQMRIASSAIDEISTTAGRLLILMGGLELGYRGECRAKARTMAGKLGCSQRTIERCLKLLGDLGLIIRVRRRIRWASRNLTEVGRLAVAIMRRARFHIVADHLADHIREADPNQKIKNETEKAGKVMGLSSSGSAKPKINAKEYAPRVGGFMTKNTWDSIAEWIMLDGSQSWARCKIAHRSFRGMINSIHKSKEWPRYSRSIAEQKGYLISADNLVMMAVQDAVRLRKPFRSVESAFAYTQSIIIRCVENRRIPGEI